MMKKSGFLVLEVALGNLEFTAGTSENLLPAPSSTSRKVEASSLTPHHTPHNVNH